MSHEIRTPMNAILGIAEIQLLDKTMPQRAEEAFFKIYDSGNLLLNIINDILDFSKIEAGRLEITPVKYDIPSLLNDTMQLNRLRYESKPIDFRLRIDENTPLELIGDELRLKQILNNLLSNAFKYTDKGEIELSVGAEYETTKDNEELVTLVLRVRDTGQGMSSEQLNALFEEYTRFNMDVNRTISGTGLGMSITKRLIDMVDGRISVESSPGKGSVFTVRLPQKRIGREVCGTNLAENLRSYGYQSGTSMRKVQFIREYMPYGSVIVVDDVESNTYVARGMLMPYGLAVETASSGEQVVGRVESGREYDIIFMDHMMPGMDGIEATRLIREMGYTKPIVALTANAIVGQAEVFLSSGFDGFLSKPIDSRELNSCLNEFIRDKQTPEVLEAARKEQETKSKLQTQPDAIDENIVAAFLRDAKNAIKVFEDTMAKKDSLDDEDIRAYTTQVHGMKTALTYISQRDLSAIAAGLEAAGDRKDAPMIISETPSFLDSIRRVVDELKPSAAEEAAAEEAASAALSDEDIAYLKEKLTALHAACKSFNVNTARPVMAELKGRTWPATVSEHIEGISVLLLHSSFKTATAAAETALSEIVGG
jgi:CheY-like chemotaxis protein/anti-sigma regulatory factor (Ser/Thr protein kinase)